GVRPGLNSSGNAAREVNTKKWKTRIRDRINQTSYEASTSRNDLVILSAEGHDLQTLTVSRKPHHAVAVKTGTIDRKVRFNRRTIALDDNRLAVSPDTAHLRLSQDLSTAGFDQFGILAGDSGVIGDPGARYVKRSDSCAMRLELAQSILIDHCQARNSIGRSPAQEFL